MKKYKLFDSSRHDKVDVYFRRLSDVSDFECSLKSKILEIKDITNPKKIVILNFDLEGRIMNIKLKSELSEGEIKVFERSFDGRFYVYLENCKNLEIDNKDIYRYYDYYNETIGEDLKISKFLINSVTLFLKEMLDKKSSNHENLEGLAIIDNACNLYNWKGLLKERLIIQKIYCNSISVLPPEVRPDQNPIFSVIQVTCGCWIKDKKGPCKFCSSYCGVDYREKEIQELVGHINKVRVNSGKTWQYVKKVFLLDADPLHTKIKTEIYFNALKKELPNVEWYESFISTSTILSKSVSEWKKIIKLGLKKVYWGVESADDRTLMLLGKPQTKESLYKAAATLNKAGINYVTILMSGFANMNYENNHIEETSKFINDINAKNVYISRFTPQPGTEIFNLIKEGRLIFPSVQERELEHRTMIKMIGLDDKKHIVKNRIIRGTYGVQFNR